MTPFRQWLADSREANFIRHTVQEFVRHDLSASAGSLTYATLLSLVPILAMIGSMAAALPGSEVWEGQIVAFLNDNFLALADENMRGQITGYLDQLTANANKLGWTMGIFLIFASIMLITNIERALNRIWGVHTARSWVNRFVIYWSTLTFGPILLGASLALSSYFFSIQFVTNAQEFTGVKTLLQFGTPFVVAALAFFLLFVIVPNRQVSWRHAIVGALLTALMFELAKKGFGWYAGRTESYERIYGALAVIPLFLVWIYLSWTVILLGASFTASMESFRFNESENLWPERREFVLLYRLIGHFHQAQLSGEGLTLARLMQLEPGADDHQLQELLENLRLAKVLRRDEEGEWVLIRDLSELTLQDLYATGVYVWPLNADPVDQDQDQWNESLAAALTEISGPLIDVTARPLKQFFEAPADSLSTVSAPEPHSHAG